MDAEMCRNVSRFTGITPYNDSNSRQRQSTSLNLMKRQRTSRYIDKDAKRTPMRIQKDEGQSRYPETQSNRPLPLYHMVHQATNLSITVRGTRRQRPLAAYQDTVRKH